MKDKVIVGLDYGRSFIGVSTSIGFLASPLGVIYAKDKKIEVVGADLLKMLSNYNVDFLVVGLSEGAMEQETRRWAKSLADVVQLRVEFIDETLSSLEADEKRSHDKAAAVILQRYIDNSKVKI